MSGSHYDPDWWRDERIRDEVHMRIRGLIREGYYNFEIARRLGIKADAVAKQRKLIAAKEPKFDEKMRIR